MPSQKKYLLRVGKMKERVERSTLEYMNEYDPSEAIRSNEIIPLMNEHFNIKPVN